MAIPWEARVYSAREQFRRRRAAQVIQRSVRAFQRRRYFQRTAAYNALSDAEQDRLTMLPYAARTIARRYRRNRLVRASQTGQLVPAIRRYLTRIQRGR